MASTEMTGQRVVITGGVRGLGFALSTLFVSRGAKVAIIDIDGDGLKDAVDRLGGKSKAIGIASDIRRRDNAHKAFASAAEQLGQADILINNAGVYPRKPILEIDDDAWDYTFDVNLRAMFHMTVAAANHMKPRRAGRIVSIASIDAYIPYAKNAHYAAAKAGVISFTKSFAQELAPEGILVNAVSPGPIDTPNLRALGIYDDLAKSTPLGRVADPSDIAEVVYFLASDRNRYMTGETVIAGGGIIMV